MAVGNIVLKLSEHITDHTLQQRRCGNSQFLFYLSCNAVTFTGHAIRGL